VNQVQPACVDVAASTGGEPLGHRHQPPRVTLRRQVTTAAAGAGSEQEFFARLDRAGVLARKRFSARNPGEVTGYAVALPGDTGKDGGPVWYGGGKLAADLTWPRISRRWTRPGTAPGSERFTAAERSAIWEHAAQAVADAAAQIRLVSCTNPAAAADAAWATSDTLHVAAAALGSHILAQAADAYDRAARHPGGRIPPTPAGNQLRRAARLISALASLAKDSALAPLMLITRLAALAEAVAVLRDTQRRAAQAAAARASVEHLYAAARMAPAPPPPGAPRPHCGPTRRAGLPRGSRARSSTARTWTTWPWSGQPAASVRAISAAPAARSPALTIKHRDLSVNATSPTEPVRGPPVMG
jgi:hypothetical protein